MHTVCGGARFQSAWYALYTKHQHEKNSVRLLCNKGFETLLPLYTSTRRWRDRTKIISVPLFPCYVFVKTDISRRLDLLNTPGIHSVVSSAGTPVSIPSDEIEAIRRAVESGADVEPHPILQCGEEVRVVNGSLAGIQGKLLRKKNENRLVVSIEILGQAAAVEIDIRNVQRVN
jgi:transcription antitermination factor NusG